MHDITTLLFQTISLFKLFVPTTVPNTDDSKKKKQKKKVQQKTTDVKTKQNIITTNAVFYRPNLVHNLKTGYAHASNI